MQLSTKEAIEYILKDRPTLNKSRLARILGIYPQGLNAYLKNKSNASLKVADKIKEKFDIELNDVTYFNRKLTDEEY